jgi:hypothetical protein
VGIVILFIGNYLFNLRDPRSLKHFFKEKEANERENNELESFDHFILNESNLNQRESERKFHSDYFAMGQSSSFNEKGKVREDKNK